MLLLGLVYMFCFYVTSVVVSVLAVGSFCLCSCLCCFYLVYMLFLCCLYVVYMLFICCLYVVLTLFKFSRKNSFPKI